MGLKGKEDRMSRFSIHLFIIVIILEVFSPYNFFYSVTLSDLATKNPNLLNATVSNIVSYF